MIEQGSLREFSTAGEKMLVYSLVTLPAISAALFDWIFRLSISFGTYYCGFKIQATPTTNFIRKSIKVTQNSLRFIHQSISNFYAVVVTLREHPEKTVHIQNSRVLPHEANNNILNFHPTPENFSVFLQRDSRTFANVCRQSTE